MAKVKLDGVVYKEEVSFIEIVKEKINPTDLYDASVAMQAELADILNDDGLTRKEREEKLVEFCNSWADAIDDLSAQFEKVKKASSKKEKEDDDKEKSDAKKSTAAKK